MRLEHQLVGLPAGILAGWLAGWHTGPGFAGVTTNEIDCASSVSMPSLPAGRSP